MDWSSITQALHADIARNLQLTGTHYVVLTLTLLLVVVLICAFAIVLLPFLPFIRPLLFTSYFSTCRLLQSTMNTSMSYTSHLITLYCTLSDCIRFTANTLYPSNTVPSVLERDPLKLPYADTARSANSADMTGDAAAEKEKEKDKEIKTGDGMHILYRYFYCTASIPSHPVLPILPYPILSCPILSYPILSYPVLSCPVLPYPTLPSNSPFPTILYSILLHLPYSTLILTAGTTVPPRITPAFEDPRVTFMTPPTLQGFGTQHSMLPKPIKFNVREEDCVCVCVCVCVYVFVCVLFIYDFHPRIQLLPSFLSPTYLSSFLLLPFFCFLLPSFFPLSYFLTFFFTSFLPLLASIVLFLTSLPPSLS